MSARGRGALVAAGIAALVALGAGLLLLRSRGAGAAERIAAEYGNLLVEAVGVETGSADTVVEVAAITDLAKLAESAGRMIVHESSPDGNAYLVADESALYVHRVAGPSGTLPPLPTPRRADPEHVLAHDIVPAARPTSRWRKR